MTKDITFAGEVALAFLCIQLMDKICCVILIGFLIPKKIKHYAWCVKIHGALWYITLLHMTEHITSAVEVTLSFLCIQLMNEICGVILIRFLIPK